MGWPWRYDRIWGYIETPSQYQRASQLVFLHRHEQVEQNEYLYSLVGYGGGGPRSGTESLISAIAPTSKGR